MTKIIIHTIIDDNLNDFLSKKYCDQCDVNKHGKSGCCKYCDTIIDFEIIKKPSDFKKRNKNVKN